MFFPSEFNVNIYRNRNPHLNFMNNSELINHYNVYGCSEGLIASKIANRKDFIDLISQDKMILEIGPMAFPSMNVNNPNVHTVDYFSKEELRENYKNDPNVNIDNICDVTYVLKDSIPYSSVIPQIFDICFSSHNVEHVPCLITFLNNVSSILKSDSYFFLCIPDYRYCFDHFRNPSNIFEVLDSFYNKQNKPSAVSLLESRYINCHNDSVKHWEFFNNSIVNIFNTINEKNDFFNNQKKRIIDEIESIKKEYEICKTVYKDAHCWKFTPFIFRNIIDILYETKFIDFKIEKVYPTFKGSNEFYVILKKN
jgi:hypothetical protein